MKLKKTACILFTSLIVLTNISIKDSIKIKAATTPKTFTRDESKAPSICYFYLTG